MTRITVDQAALAAGEPAWLLDGVRVPGFETVRGATFIRARDRQAWLDFAGDEIDIRPGGLTIPPASQETVHVAFNHLPRCQYERLKATPGLHFGAVNQADVRAGRVGCTAYRWEPGGEVGHILCPSIRFSGAVRSVTMVPPLPTPGPLNCWIEIVADGRHNRVEFLGVW